jgi:hypothetical protein
MRGEQSQRLKKILSGAFAGPPTPLKDIPTRHGESRRIGRNLRKRGKTKPQSKKKSA